MPAGGAPCVIAVARLAAEHDHKHNARDRDEQQCGRPRAAGVVQAAEAQRQARQQQRPPQLAGSARRRPTERVSRAAPQGRQDREQQPRPPEFRARRAAVKVRVVREKAADSFHRPNGAHGGGRAARQTSHGARAAGCPAPRAADGASARAPVRVPALERVAQRHLRCGRTGASGQTCRRSGQARRPAAPHLVQNLVPSASCCPQCSQYIMIPLVFRKALNESARLTAGVFISGESSENGRILDVFPVFQAARLGQKIRCSAADDLFRDPLVMYRLM